MPASALILSLLLVACFGMAAQLQLWQSTWQGGRSQSDDLLEVLMGDSRRLFANHFFVKSDVYFHSGYYPTVFDLSGGKQEIHIAEDAGARPESHTDEKKAGAEHHEEDFLGPPRDWIDAFSRSFFPSKHSHLDERGGGSEREILPWLRISADLDPHRVETYTTAAYWLRQHLGKYHEAKQFLREGWRENPDSDEIIFELGRVYDENEKDLVRARNLYELALRKWREKETSSPDPNIFLYQQIVGRLAKLEEDEKHLPQAVTYLEMLLKVSPRPENVRQQIAELRQKMDGQR